MCIRDRIGTNNRGLDHIEAIGGLDNVELAYVCDVDDGALAKGMDQAVRTTRSQPKALKDFRKALEDPSLDAVTIAVPDHWHTPMAILALAAGKHVYVEKPCSQNPHEGELLLQAIARYGRLVQMGTQRRSFPNMQIAIREIHDGVIGRAYYAKGWYENNRKSIGRGMVVPVPSTPVSYTHLDVYKRQPVRRPPPPNVCRTSGRRARMPRRSGGHR